SASVAQDGSWHYTVSDAGAVDALAAGETLSDTFTVKAADSQGGFGSEEDTIALKSPYDAACIPSAAQKGAVSEGDDGASQSASGQFTFSDVDARATHTFLPYTTLFRSSASVAQDGSWHYTVSDAGAVDALAAGETLSDTFTVKVADSQGGFRSEERRVGKAGSNDAPVVTSEEKSGAVSEGDDGASQSATGQVTFSDVDTSDTHTFSLSSAAAYGSASVVHDGSWYYTVSYAGAVDALAAGETLSDTFTVKVADSQGGFASQDVKITITGTNDSPVINGGP